MWFRRGSAGQMLAGDCACHGTTDLEVTVGAATPA
jgi:hypothetical protein